MRDSQRSRVYKADGSLNDVSQRFETIAECRQYVIHTLNRGRVQGAFPKLAVWLLDRIKSGAFEFRDGRGRRSSCAGMFSMSLIRSQRITGIILHELAHSLHIGESTSTSTRNKDDDRQVHGWRFCDIYLTLVLHAMGREAHDKLKAGFKEHKVRFRPKRKREMTEEQRAILRDRLAQARSKAVAVQ
jgi:hypothetical protein